MSFYAAYFDPQFAIIEDQWATRFFTGVVSMGLTDSVVNYTAVGTDGGLVEFYAKETMGTTTSGVPRATCTFEIKGYGIKRQ